MSRVESPFSRIRGKGQRFPAAAKRYFQQTVPGQECPISPNQESPPLQISEQIQTQPFSEAGQMPVPSTEKPNPDNSLETPPFRAQRLLQEVFGNLGPIRPIGLRPITLVPIVFLVFGKKEMDEQGGKENRRQDWQPSSGGGLLQLGCGPREGGWPRLQNSKLVGMEKKQRLAPEGASRCSQASGKAQFQVTTTEFSTPKGEGTYLSAALSFSQLVPSIR